MAFSPSVFIFIFFLDNRLLRVGRLVNKSAIFTKWHAAAYRDLERLTTTFRFQITNLSP